MSGRPAVSPSLLHLPAARARNLATLFLARAQQRPDARFGSIEDPLSRSETVSKAIRAATLLAGSGVEASIRVAVIGSSGNDYLVTWLALQLLGAQPALINPGYPASLLADMLTDLQPSYVVWIDLTPDRSVHEDAVHLDCSEIAEGKLNGATLKTPALELVDLPGLRSAPSDIAGFMHTSGTTGVPKFCVQTHEYFLRLGRFIADSHALSPIDTVYAPLPLFHINPLGYGVIGGLVGGADILVSPRFSASRFWNDVVKEQVTVLILHAPPIEILKRSTTSAQAEGHQVRIMFFADEEFIEMFDIPSALSGYGSTEAAGLTHTWCWRQGERAIGDPQMSRYSGASRHDIAWTVADNGEILVRELQQNVLFSGYLRQGEIAQASDEGGWFQTGDLGRVDYNGNLIFIEREAESIRVKGEYVPVSYVEQQFAGIEGVRDIALWRRQSALVDHEPVLYIVAPKLDIERMREVASALPAFMRPVEVYRVDELPRDSGVGKVRRRQLAGLEVRETILLSDWCCEI